MINYKGQYNFSSCPLWWEEVYETLTKYKYEILELKPYLKEILNDNNME